MPSTWGLINLILALFALLFLVGQAIWLVGKRPNLGSFIVIVFMLGLGVVPSVLFMALENMQTRMVLANGNTLMMLLLVAVQIVFGAIVRKMAQKKGFY